MGQAAGYNTMFPQSMPPPQPAPPPPAPPTQDNNTNTTLLSETRQQTTEVRLEIQKISSKVDDIASKIDRMREEGGTAGSGSLVSRGSAPTMETSVLLHNIQRMVQVCYYNE